MQYEKEQNSCRQGGTPREWCFVLQCSVVCCTVF